MKKKFCLVMLLCLCIGSINAEEQNNSATIKEVTTLRENGTYYHQEIELADGKTGYLYDIELDGQVALCMDLGKKLNSNDSFKYTGTSGSEGAGIQGDNETIKKALYYLNDHHDDASLRVAAILTWENGDKEAAKKNITNSKELSILDDIFSYSAPDDVELTTWAHVSGSGDYQRLITTVSGKTNSPCTITVNDNLATCGGSSNSNHGFVSETAIGSCPTSYDNTKQGQLNSILGTKQTDYGHYCRMYCLKNYNEYLPGNITTPVYVGTYIVWPNNNSNNNRYKTNANLPTYPMSAKLDKTCKISVDKTHLQSDYQTQYNIMRTQRGIDSEACQDYIDTSCSYTEQRLNEARSQLAAARASLAAAEAEEAHLCDPYCDCDTYTDEDGDEYEVCSVCSGCSAAQAEVAHWSAEVAKWEKEVAKWEKKLQVCQTYGKANSRALNIVNDFNGCIGAKANLTLSFSLKNPRSTYNDPEYSGEFNLVETSASSSCENCTSNIAKIQANKANVDTITPGTVVSYATPVEARKIVKEIKKSYDIYDNHNGIYYYYVDKLTGKSSSNRSSFINFSNTGFSNMPISYDANPKKTYSLSIKTNGITGDGNEKISQKIASHDYTCNYKVSKLTTPPCQCPAGTMNEGLNLMDAITGTSLTCADAKEKYCNSPNPPIPNPPSCEAGDANCPSNTYTCPNNSRDLTTCVGSGLTLNDCINKYCNVRCTTGCSGEKWVCPAGTNEGMDLTSCVIPMMIKGYSEKQAYNYCKDVTCPYKGIKIIYRIIDLSNPFPSKDADKKVEQPNLRKGMFNDDLKGRYPGYNWNGTEVVKNKILNNRNVDGDNVYKKQPLYTFVVNTEKLKAIRSYNKAQSNKYDDFKLKCLNGSSACKSEFVHNQAYGLVSGTCYSISKDNFYSCAK